MNLGENLKKIRKDNNLSQEQLAEALGVSRQSVSKWESNQAYPEMDKVLQIANMFNLNIDDLLNQDIREVTSEKQSKIAINKYIDDFLSFITKTIDMFSSMKFKDKCKCLIEQCVIIFLLIILFVIIEAIVSNILSGILAMLPENIIYILKSFFKSIYLIFALILGSILLIHIFKVRYLEYYIIVKESNTLEEINIKEKQEKLDETTNKPKKIYLEKKKEKIIIRDPNHSEYKFISGMIKCLLLFIKGIILMIALTLCITLICLVLSLIVSFLIIKTGLFFLGIFLTTLSGIIINIIVIVILFNFIINKKSKKKILLITFIISLLLCGKGIGIGIIGFTSFDYIDDINNDIYKEDEIIIPMKNELTIDHYLYYYNNIELKEEDRQDLRIVYKHSKYYELSNNNYYNDFLFLEYINSNNNFINVSREVIKDINNKKIINYSKFKITIYTSKENIGKIKNNQNKYEEQYDYYNRLEEENNRYQIEISEYENKIYDLKNQLNEKEQEIDNLQEELNYCINE